MKNFQYLTYPKAFAALLLFCTMASSCKKLIEIPASPPSQLSSGQVFADSTNIIGAIAGVYTSFGVTTGGGLITNSMLYTGLSGDELTTGAYDVGDVQFMNNSLISSNSYVSKMWSDAYSNIYQVNACIAGITSTTAISAALKKQLIGEIKVVRALYYFRLVNLYGGVPLVLSTDYTTTAKIPRATVDNVYLQITTDLTDAVKSLSVNYPSAGRARPNIYVAKALLANVYLYRGDWQNAETLTTEVINSGVYSLEADLNNVFLDGSNEAIWQLPANGQYSQTTDGQFFVSYADGVASSYPVSAFLKNAFEADDQRLEKWIGTSQVDENGDGNLTASYYPYKYKNRDAAVTPAEDYMMIRLGEVYLIRAEARARLSKLAEATADENMVRTRAGLTASTAANSTEVVASIMHERQTELFCEGASRWFDLKRWATIDAVLAAEKPNWKSSFALFPIPIDQMRLNPFLTQNPGYN